MAGDWIKMRTDLADDPAVISISLGLNVDRDLVVGKLHKLWSWADRHTVDGNAERVTFGWIDSYLGIPDFGNCLIYVGWLEVDGNSIRIPNFERHNGASAKQRALTAKRVANHKGLKRVTASALPREEKRREDIDTSNDVSRTRAKFIRPTIEEVTAYCQSRSNQVDPQAFVNHYESNGWRVGRNPMKDWKAAVHTWERNGFQALKSNGSASGANSKASESYDVLCCEVRRVGAGQIPSYPNQASRDAVKAMGGWRAFCDWSMSEIEWRRKRFLENYK